MKIVKSALIATAIAAASSAFAAGAANPAAPVNQPDAVTSRFLAALNGRGCVKTRAIA